MNFQEKFEAWHKSKFGYVASVKSGSTKLDCKYQSFSTQARWEGWQACDTRSFIEGQISMLVELIEMYPVDSAFNRGLKQRLKQLEGELKW